MVLGEDFEADVIRNTLIKSKDCAETAPLKDYSWNVNSVNQVVLYNKHSEMLSKWVFLGELQNQKKKKKNHLGFPT